MKKVLAIAPYPYLPYFSGGQKFIAQFFEYFGKEVDLTVITSIKNDLSLAIHYKTIPLLKKSFSRYFDRSMIKKITELVQEKRFGTLIIEHPYLAWLAFAVRKRTGIKVVIHSHNIEYQRFKSTGRWWWPILRYYERKSYKKTDAIFFITNEDKNFAITNWKIPPEKCIDLPFGIDINSNPLDRDECNSIVKKTYTIEAADKILLFTGQLGYKPNLDALKVILDKINPFLLQQSTFQYKIIVCGKGLPSEMDDLKPYINKNVIYAGFIKDIDTYYKAADIFLNPVLSGGGIKTKMVEAIAYGTTVISTENGASGIKRDICGEKLIIVNDNQWSDFANSIEKNINLETRTPVTFYNEYYWEKIISRLLISIK